VLGRVGTLGLVLTAVSIAWRCRITPRAAAVVHSFGRPRHLHIQTSSLKLTPNDFGPDYRRENVTLLTPAALGDTLTQVQIGSALLSRHPRQQGFTSWKS
jgi:hypothetical protein